MTKAPSGGVNAALVEMTLAGKVFVAPRCPLWCHLLVRLDCCEPSEVMVTIALTGRYSPGPEAGI